jgi:hypothetical protein
LDHLLFWLFRFFAIRRSMAKQRLITFGGGGWVLLLAGAITLGLLAWGLAPALLRTANRPPGDGKNIESYRFDLSNLLVDRSLVVPAMLHRDMAPPLTAPTATGPNQSLTTNDPERWKAMQRRSDPKYGKYLVSSDLVIGVEVGGEARAYPLSIMFVHEIINDTLGSVPIAVTYHWPCDSVVVFDRRVGERVIDLGVSGLVYNSNLLMYERTAHDVAATAGGGESLWSQLLAKAVSGPAAGRGEALALIPAELVTWGDWSARKPQTSVVDRDLRLTDRYKDGEPPAHFQSDKLKFPVRPLPPADGPEAKTPVLAVAAGSARRVYPISYILHMASNGEWTDSLGSIELRFIADRTRGTVRIEPNDAVQAVHAYWFAWHAMHPDDPLVNPSGDSTREPES